jgi:large repetitive protein
LLRKVSLSWRIRPILRAVPHGPLPRAFAACLLLASTTTLAAPPRTEPLRRVVPIDASAPAGPERRVPLLLGPQERALLKPGAPVHAHETFGVPDFVWAAPQPGPADAGGGHGSPVDAARAHLARFARLYRLEPEDLARLEAGTVHDTGRGAIIVSLRPRVDGLEIFREEIRIGMDRGLRAVALSGFTLGNRAALARSGAPRFVLDFADAAAAALADHLGEDVAARDLVPQGARPGGYRLFAVDPDTGGRPWVLADPLRVRRLLFRLPDRLEASYYVEVSVGDEAGADGDLVSYVISAVDGRVLFRHDMTASDVFAYRVWADPITKLPDDGPQGTSPSPHPTGVPDGFQAAFTSPVLLSLQNGPISTNDPWLPSGAVETTGNNAEAYADITAPDGFNAGDLRASTTSASTFDRTYNTASAPGSSNTQRMAAVTQLFYDVNFLHDWFYDHGFNEAAGNAQTSNYGRGGLEADALKVEGQDSSGRNNANMSTPSDGARPRMQMYVFDGLGRRSLTISTPPAIAGTYNTGYAAFGPPIFTTPGQVVLVNDGSTAGGGSLTDACETPFANAAQISGRLALVDRGSCSFVLKVKNAQLNGAIGVVITNNLATGVVNMSGTDATITIPSLFISQADGNTIKAQLGSVVNGSLFREVAVDRDGTIDNQVVAHEWGHYISNRLIGNANGLSNQQGGGMGEGWGDFTAMLVTVRPEDATAPAGTNFTGVYGVVTYVTSGGNGSGGWNDGYYFGIRRYPYSINMSRNPLTFKHISDGTALPPGVPVEGDTTGSSNSEVHNTGEVWASMLWECYAALLRDTPRLTFDQARSRMMDYLVAGYKMTPNAPTLLEARDAVLAAAFAADPQDYALLWQAFAKRGAGLHAVAPDRFSTTQTGVVESFLTGGELVLEGATLDDSIGACDNDGILDVGESGRVTFTLRNSGSKSLVATTAVISSSDPDVLFPAGTALSLPPSAPFDTFSTSVEVRLTAGGPFLEVVPFTLSVDDAGLGVPGPVDMPFTVRGHFDQVPSATETVESVATPWTPGGAPGFTTTGGWKRVEISPTQHRWYGPDPASLSDQWLVSPPLQVAPSGNFTISFQHRHSFETANVIFYDGGVLEISSNGGATWSDVASFAATGYNGSITTGGGNVLGGRNAWVGTNLAYPSLSSVSINLGTAFAGQTVRVRFRVGTDQAAGAAGWEIDDLVFGNLTNQPFQAVVSEAQTCTDSDLDGRPDVMDCAPLDGVTWAAPSEALDLQLAGQAATALTWRPPSSPGGSTPHYDVIRSTLGSSFNPAVCVETDQTDLGASDPAQPGTAFYYLVRSRNACGSNLGTSSSGVPHTGAACP